jgi:hypothetical protein
MICLGFPLYIVSYVFQPFHFLDYPIFEIRISTERKRRRQQQLVTVAFFAAIEERRQQSKLSLPSLLQYN